MSITNPDVFTNYPYPLGAVIKQTLTKAVLRDQGERIPDFPFDICRCFGLLLRMDAALAIKAYVDSGSDDVNLNIKIVDTLRNPTDGSWRELLVLLVLKSKQDKSIENNQLIVDLTRALNKKLVINDGKKSVSCINILAELVKYRNDLIHGKRLDDGDHDEALQKLQAVLNAHHFYARTVVLVNHSASVYRCDGTAVKPISEALDSALTGLSDELRVLMGKEAEDCPVLISLDHQDSLLRMHPLLHFNSESGDVRFDDLFFVNRATRDAMEYIAYRNAGHFNAHTLGNYESFRKFISDFHTPNLPKEKRLSFHGLYEFHHERFVGRENIIEDIERVLCSTDCKYVELRALAGMGKTAIMAELFGKYGTREALPWPYPANTQSQKPLPHNRNRWAFHFCSHQDGRDDPVIVLQSLVSQLCDGAALQRSRYLSNEPEVQRQKFSECLNEVKKQLTKKCRIFICIDALDEGLSASGERSIPKALFGMGEQEPDFPEGVVFLVSYRIQENGDSAVDKHMEHIPGDWRARIASADPLSGLNKSDVHSLIDRLAKQRGLSTTPEKTLAAIWDAASTKASSVDANPLYLRFLGDDILVGVVDLNRIESIPSNLDAVFERVWMTLPTDHDYAVHRMIGTLAILRQYGTDELLHYVINATRSKHDPLPLDEIRRLRLSASKLLVYQGDRFTLFHDKFREFLIGPQQERLQSILTIAMTEE
jgi:hypothetical protein